MNFTKECKRHWVTTPVIVPRPSRVIHRIGSTIIASSSHQYSPRGERKLLNGSLCAGSADAATRPLARRRQRSSSIVSLNLVQSSVPCINRPFNSSCELRRMTCLTKARSGQTAVNWDSVPGQRRTATTGLARDLVNRLYILGVSQHYKKRSARMARHSVRLFIMWWCCWVS